MALPLEGKVAIVTGSSRGIGKATALQLAQDGCDVVVCGRSLESTDDFPGSIGETAEAIRALGRRALAVQCDVLVDDDLRRLVEETMREFGRLDILVNNAAVMDAEPFLESDVSGLERSFAANVRAPFVMTQLAVPHLIASGGGIVVNISSGAASNPAPPAEADPNRPRFQQGPEYGVSKAALDRLSTGIAEELGEKNVAVVSIWPGFTMTERVALRSLPGLDKSMALPMETTAKTVAFVCREPMQHNGRILMARQVVEQNGL